MSEDERTTTGEGEATASASRSLTPRERLLLLDMWQRSGLTARDFGALVGLSRHTLFDWKKKFDRSGPVGLADRRRGAPRGSRLSEPTHRAILMLKQAHPEWGCERIREVLLRGEGYSASAGANRGITRGGVTCSCSSGFGAAWRCRRERWRYTVVCDKSA